MKPLHGFFPLLAFLVAAAGLGNAATIRFVTVDVATADAWRTTTVTKPDADRDNVYGTDGYLIAQYPSGSPNNLRQPSYGTIALVPGRNYEGVGTEQYQARFDDVLATGPGPVPNRVAGDYYVNGGPDGNVQSFFTFTLNRAASFRLGVITDQTPRGANPAAVFYEASKGVRVTGPGGLDTGVIDVLGPGESWKNGSPNSPNSP